MNILYTITSYPPAVGGTQFYTHQIATRLSRSGCRVRVVSHWDQTRYDWLLGTTVTAHGQPREYTTDGVPVHRLALSAWEKAKLLPFVPAYWIVQGLAIRQISNLLLSKLRALDTDWQIIHNVRQGREGLSYASLRFARYLNVPFVFTPVHHPRWGGWLHRHYHALYRVADAIIALTNAEKDVLVGLGVQQQKIHVTGMGPVLAPEAQSVRFRQEHALGTNPVVLFLGTHYPYKGLGVLVSAAPLVWQVHPDTHFVFAGLHTSYSRRLRARHPDNRLLWLGSVDLQTKTDALAACDLLCVPSTQESFGGVYTEAWMMDKPVIGGDIPAIREVIADGVDGYVVRQEPAAIAAKICALLADSPLRRQMGERGKAKVLSHYTWDKLVERTQQVYTQVLAEHKGAQT